MKTSIDLAAGNAPQARDDYAIVLAGHGSRDPDGVREFEALAALIQERAPHRLIRHGYLEFAAPTLDVAVRDAIAAGARHVVMVPGVLLAATHAKNDMPSELLALQREFPEIHFDFGAALDLHPKLLALCEQRIIEAEAAAHAGAATVARADSCLVVVGRGTSDPDANSDIAKLTRMLEEGLGFGSSLVCYAGTARPKVADGLRAAARLGFSRLVVLPYFLFDGILVKRIRAAVDEVRLRHTGLEVLMSNYLGVHPHLADVFLERAQEGAEGRAAMNCALCQYRVQIVGFEEQVGRPQQAHHLAVRGKSTASSGALIDPAPIAIPATGTAAQAPAPAGLPWQAYIPHPIEAQSMRIIDAGRDWSGFAPDQLSVLKRIVHTSGDFNAADEVFFSPGASAIGIRALLRCRRIVTDVTMVQSGLKQALLRQLDIATWCGVHDDATHVLANATGLTRSAAGIRRAWERFGNDLILAIGDAPTAVMEAVRLVEHHGWRPQLIIGLPVGFVGTRECKDSLRDLMQVPRITNRGTRGGSPWAATVLNALMIEAIGEVGALEAADAEIKCKAAAPAAATAKAEVASLDCALPVSAGLGEFLGIGVGPGTGGLIPVAAVAALRDAEVIFVPRARGAAESVARLSLAALELPEARFREIEFLMDPDRSVLRAHYAQLATQVVAELRAGRSVAYLTIGDTLTYSTYGYLLAALRDLEPALRHRTFPGVTSFAATAAALSWPLGEGRERILILPCPDEMEALRADILSHDIVVLMKIGRRLPQVLALLGELGLLAHCAFGHRVGLPGEQLYADLLNAPPAEAAGYLATMLIRREPREPRHR